MVNIRLVLKYLTYVQDRGGMGGESGATIPLLWKQGSHTSLANIRKSARLHSISPNCLPLML